MNGRSTTEGPAEEILGAPPWPAFPEITLPLMVPAVIASVLLAFTPSFDDV